MPSGVDFKTSEFLYVETSEGIIRRSAFIDGRTPIAVKKRLHRAPITAALEWQEAQVNQLNPAIIFHTSFCGSTLLSGLLQASSTALVYREPHILSELATLKSGKHPVTRQNGHFQAVLAFVLGQFRKSWSDVTTIIKPSNWANTLLPELTCADLTKQSLIAMIDEEEFLLANLRGGKQRLAYSLALLNHLLQSGMVSRSLVLDIERGGHTPTGRLLRLLTALYQAQDTLLSTNLPEAERISLREIQETPKLAVCRAGRAIGIRIDPDLAESTIPKVIERHAKDHNTRYSSELEASENHRLRNELSADFIELKEWKRQQLRQTG